MKNDITGKRFGRLIVTNESEVRKSEVSGINYTYLKCLCDCGNEKFIRKPHLVSGDTKSCGCHYREKLKEKRKKENSTGIPHNPLNLWTKLPNK